MLVPELYDRFCGFRRGKRDVSGVADDLGCKAEYLCALCAEAESFYSGYCHIADTGKCAEEAESCLAVITLGEVPSCVDRIEHAADCRHHTEQRENTMSGFAETAPVNIDLRAQSERVKQADRIALTICVAVKAWAVGDVALDNVLIYKALDVLLY